MGRVTNQRTLWLCLRLCLGLLASGFLGGCGDSPLSARYAAEKLLWSGRSLERRFWNNPEAASEERLGAEAAYRQVLSDYPLTRVAGDARETLSLTRTRVMAAITLARLDRRAGRTGAAARVLYDMRSEANTEVDTGLLVHMELVQLLRQPSQRDSLAAVLREITEDLPPADENGAPIPLVLEAPLRLVELEESRGNAAAAASELAQAQIYYSDVAAKHPGSDVEVAATIERAKTEIKQGRMRDAAATLSGARSLPNARRFEPTLIYSSGNLALQGLGDARGGLDQYRELIRRFPDDPNSPEAALQIGVAWSSLGEIDSALAAFDFTEKRYSRAPNQAAQARLAGARVLSLEKRWPEALRRLRGLQTDYPRTPAGLVAPVEIAAYYDRMGEAEASRTALEAAVGTYDGSLRELLASPDQAEAASLTFEHLADAHERLAQWDRAVEVLLARADRFPADPAAVRGMFRAAAILEQKLGDRARAADTFEKLAERYPDLPTAERARARASELRGASS